MACRVSEGRFECPICSVRFKDPCAIPCHHVFCRACITAWLRRSPICPTCRKPANVNEVAKIHLIAGIIEDAETEESNPCGACGKGGLALINCEHCSKSICSTCQANHVEEVKKEITQLCDTLTTVTAPKLEEQNEAIIMLMSESTAAKDRLTGELREAHETLVTQIYSLRQKSLDILNKIETSCHPDANENLASIDALIARIETLSSSSVKVIAERDMSKLMQLDKDIAQLQDDINSFQSQDASVNIKSLDINQSKITLDNVKINPAYKYIAAVIEETEMLKKAVV